MSVDPKFNYANATDLQLRGWALAGGRQEFGNLLDGRLLNNESLFILFGEIDEQDNFVEIGREGFGRDWEKFVQNVDPQNGKIATVIYYRMDSATAFERFGESVGTGARQWAGGVYLSVSITLANGEKRVCELAGASSGVQGVFDAAVTSGSGSSARRPAKPRPPAPDIKVQRFAPFSRAKRCTGHTYGLIPDMKNDNRSDRLVIVEGVGLTSLAPSVLEVNFYGRMASHEPMTLRRPKLSRSLP